MKHIEVKELFSAQLEQYKTFLAIGCNEETLLLTPNDNANAKFPTKDSNDSFTLAAFSDQALAGVASFSRDGEDREKLRHKGILFTMFVSKEFRGQGIAGQLLEAIIHRVRTSSDIEQINLIV
ncbi:MAG: GNAT family N-acetyltransferase, partial [Bacteroidia bacterium]